MSSDTNCRILDIITESNGPSGVEKGSAEVLYLGSNMAYLINEYNIFSFQVLQSPVWHIQLINTVYSSSELIRKEKMVDEHHLEVQKASTSKGVESPIDDATHNDNKNGSSSSSEGPNFRGFTDEETKVLNSMIRKQVGKAIKKVMPFYISQTTDNLKEIIQKELAEFKRGGISNDYRN
ncbi:hypothetical protein Tco_0264408 [Tanacetum coccineum]